MWDYIYLKRIDFRVIPILLTLMIISILAISAHASGSMPSHSDDSLFSPLVRHQLQCWVIGFVVFFFFAGFDYNKLREWTWILYALMIIALVGVFFVDPIQHVHRWFRIPFLNISFQPSEYAKLVVVIALSWFLERKKSQITQTGPTIFAILLVAVPFFLILRQPDLGTSLILYPLALVLFYFGGMHPSIIRTMTLIGGIACIAVSLIFLGIISHDSIRPYATLFLKEYQFDRLDPNTHHQKAAATAIALGGLTGSGWQQSEFTGGGWLPAAYTDSVFSAFGEEFGFFGLLFLIALFYSLIYCSFQVTAVAKDPFGRLLSAGITVYVAVHVLINIGMMSGFFPITGVPLVLVSYGGSSLLATMAALGILQSIYSRRFMF